MFCLFFCAGMFAGLPRVSGKEAASLTHLTDKEKAWLKAHPIIRLAPDPEFKPIEFFDHNGFYTGIAADYVQLLEQKQGIQFKVIRCANWADVTQRIKNREVDVLNAVVKTPQRETYLRFPPPYLKIPSVIIARKNVSADLTLDMLKGMKIVMVSGYGYVDLIRNKYPELNIEFVPELKTALRKVSFGMADAFVGDLATTSFYIESEGITNLKIAGETEPPNISGFAVRSDWPELSAILEKGMALITADEKKAIFNKWIHLTVEPGMTMPEFKKYALITLCITLFLILFVLFLNRQLKRVVTLKTEDLRKEIEDRKRTEKALGESETYLRTLIHTIPELVWLKDMDGTYLFCNSRFKRLFGTEEKQIIGKTDYDFVDKALADSFREHDKLAMDKDGPSMNEEKVTYADDGHIEILETIKTPLHDTHGKIIGVLGIARDITERKHAEEERKELEDQLRQSHKMEAVGTIAGGVAHDFNNILGIIIGNTELALMDVPEWNPAHSNLEEIKTASLRASNIIRQLLSFSRKDDQKLQPMEIAVIIKDALKFLRSTIPTTINIEQHIHAADETILADPTQINQIMMNLCINASHAMEQTGGNLIITVETVTLNDNSAKGYPDLKSGSHVKIMVADTGPGIDPKIIDRIFEPYFTTKEVGKGSGMGLSVVHGIVKNHGGTISVDSNPGKGTVFTICFPLLKEKAAIEEETIQEIPRGKETILFVDDEISIVEMMKKMFEHLGYTVETDITPQDALDRFALNPDHFDLVITDMTMPQMTGVHLSKKIMAIRPDIPIIICTGHSSLVDEVQAKVLGLAAYVMKPINMRETAKTIRKVLDRK